MITFLRGMLMFAASIALLALAYLAVSTVQNERAITAETIKSERAITAAASELPAIADRRLASIQADTLKLVDRHAKNVEAVVNGAVRTADLRLASLEDTADRQLGEANRSIATISQAASLSLPAVSGSVSQSLASISTDVHQVAVPIAGTAAQLNDAAPLYLDCEFNPSCAYNFFQGTAKAVQQSAQAVAKAAPGIADSTVKIEGHVEKISSAAEKEADVFTARKPWWKHVLDYLNALAAAGAHFL